MHILPQFAQEASFIKQMSDLMGQISEGEVTSWHEAGHVVIGLHFGFPLDRVILYQDGNPAPRTRWSPVNGEAFPLATFAIEEVMLMSLGGAAAEMLVFGVPFYHPAIFESSQRDIVEIGVQLMARGETSDPHELSKTISEYADRCRAIIEESDGLKRSLGIVAKRLFEAITSNEEFVDGSEIQQILGG